MSDIKVVVAKTWHDTVGGTEWVYISGRNTADDSGYQTRTFAEYKGSATKQAEALDSLNKGDYVLLGFKQNGKYTNLASVTKLDEEAPENSNPQTESPGTSGPAKKSYSKPAGGNGSDKMSKADWEAKDAKKEASMARHKALVVAATVKVAEGNTDAESIIELAEQFEGYLFQAPAPVVTINIPEGSVETPPVPGDDDIPF